MKRLVACAMLAAILAAACTRPAAPAREGFAIYLLAKKLSPAEVVRADLRSLRLEDTPRLSTEDIVSYTWETHEITLTAAAAERLGQLEMPVGGAGIPFVVCVGEERIYSGAFWSALSSLSFDGVVIMLLPGGQLNPIRIVAGFIGEKADPRSDARILQALESAGRLRRGAATVAPEPTAAPPLVPRDVPASAVARRQGQAVALGPEDRQALPAALLAALEGSPADVVALGPAALVEAKVRSAMDDLAYTLEVAYAAPVQFALASDELPRRYERDEAQRSVVTLERLVVLAAEDRHLDLACLPGEGEGLIFTIARGAGSRALEEMIFGSS